MKRKIVSIIVFGLLMGALALEFDIQLVKAEWETIYIREDGSIEGTDKIQQDGNVYTFTDDIYDEIVVERNNIIVDGAGFKLQGVGTGTGTGFDLSIVSNVTLRNTHITGFLWGVLIRYDERDEQSGPIPISNTIVKNIITNCSCGVGIDLYDTTWTLHDHHIIGNTIRNNECGVLLSGCNGNDVYHNNFLNNDVQAYEYDSSGGSTRWDNGYPSGGNYWSDYNGSDFYGGPYQNETWSDGLGDIPYLIDENAQDNYPLMSTEWSIEIINKDDPVDYPTSFDDEETFEIVVKVRVIIPSGEAGTIKVTVSSRIHLDPVPARLVWLSPEYQEISLGCGDGITTHEFTFDLSSPDVKRESFGFLSILADLYEGYTRKASHLYGIDYTITPEDDFAVDVKFRGIIEDVNIFWDLFPIGANITITEILEDTQSLLTVDTSIYVRDETTILEEMNITVGDRVEVLCDYYPDSYALIWQPYHYLYKEGFADVNQDGIVDIFDAVLMAKAFDSQPGDSNWNITADLNNDEVVDKFDIVLLANNFGKTA